MTQNPPKKISLEEFIGKQAATGNKKSVNGLSLEEFIGKQAATGNKNPPKKISLEEFIGKQAATGNKKSVNGLSLEKFIEQAPKVDEPQQPSFPQAPSPTTPGQPGGGGAQRPSSQGSVGDVTSVGGGLWLPSGAPGGDPYSPSPTQRATSSVPPQQPSRKAFEQRLHDPKAPRIENPDGTFSTHEMASAEVDGKYVAYPTIVQGQDGKLQRLDPDAALDHAMKSGEYRQFGSDAEARRYAEGGYKKGTVLDEAPLKMDAPAKTDRFGVPLPFDTQGAIEGALNTPEMKADREYFAGYGKLTLPEVQAIRNNDIPDQVNRLRGMEQGFLTDQKIIEEDRAALDELTQQLRERVVADPSFAPQAEAEYKAAVDRFNRQANTLNKQGQAIRDKATFIGEQEKQAIRREYEIKSKEGGFWGATYNTALDGIGSAIAGINAPLIDLIQIIENPVVTPEIRKEEIDLKRRVLKEIRGSYRDMAGVESTTQEYINEMQKGFWGGAWLSTTQSLPVAFMGPGGIGLMAQAADGVRQEMEAPEFDNIPEWKKEAFSMGVGGVVGALERMGLFGAAKNKGVVTSIMLRGIDKLPPGATAQQVKNVLLAETESYALNLGSRLAGSGLEEYSTEFAQGIAEPGLKKLFNAVEDKNLLAREDGAKGFETPNGFEEMLIDARRNAAQGFVAGTMFGAPRALWKAKQEATLSKLLRMEDFKPLEALLRDPEFANAIPEEHKRAVAAGEMTQTQADAVNASWEASRAVVEKIPEDLSPEQRKEAFMLLTEKDRLSKLDKNLVGDRITAIDEQLKALVAPAEQKVDEQTGTTATTPLEQGTGGGVVASTTEDGSTATSPVREGERPSSNDGSTPVADAGGRTEVSGVPAEAGKPVVAQEQPTPTDQDTEAGVPVQDAKDAGTYVQPDLTRDVPDEPKALAKAYWQERDRHNSEVNEDYTIYTALVNQVKPDSYASFGDRNKRTPPMAKTYFAKKGKGWGLDQIAQDLSDRLGREVTTNELVSFMENNSSGLKQRNAVMEELDRRYHGITGRKLNAVVARGILGKQRSPKGKNKGKLLPAKNTEWTPEQRAIVDAANAERVATEDIIEQDAEIDGDNILDDEDLVDLLGPAPSKHRNTATEEKRRRDEQRKQEEGADGRAKDAVPGRVDSGAGEGKAGVGEGGAKPPRPEHPAGEVHGEVPGGTASGEGSRQQAEREYDTRTGELRDGVKKARAALDKATNDFNARGQALFDENEGSAAPGLFDEDTRQNEQGDFDRIVAPLRAKLKAAEDAIAAHEAGKNEFVERRSKEIDAQTRTDEAPPSSAELDAGVDALNDWTPDDDPAPFQLPHDGQKKQEYTGKPRTDRIIKALAELAPNLSITIAKTQEEFAALVKDLGDAGVASAWGVFHVDANGKARIIINPKGPNIPNTLFHEASHPIIAALAHSRPDLFRKFYNEAIKADGGKYKRFGDLYKDKGPQVQQEEAVVQYVADILSAISRKEIPVSTRKDSLYQQVKAFIQDILAALGWDTRSIDLSKPDNVREFAGQIAKALEKGVKITGLQPSTSPMAMFANDMGITVEEAQRQYDAVVAQYTNKDGTKKGGWMKAPNGQATNLNERQWVQTRTHAFKNWFGDWEGDPKNASKVVDANGEPMVVYHGSQAMFDVFDTGRIGTAHGRSEGTGFYFTTDRSVAEGYAEGRPVYETFLNIRNPARYDTPALNATNTRKLVEAVVAQEQRKEGTSPQDGFLSNFGDVAHEGRSRVVGEATQSIAQDETLLDQVGGLVGAGVSIDVANAALKDATGHDGYVSDGFDGKGNGGGRIFVVPQSGQIKSATANTGQFGPTGNIMLKQDADRIMAEPSGMLSGDGLKVGGSGMKGFYDKILPSMAGKVGKKLGGDGKVQPVTLGTPKDAATEVGTQQGMAITPDMRQQVGGGVPMMMRPDPITAQAERYKAAGYTIEQAKAHMEGRNAKPEAVRAVLDKMGATEGQKAGTTKPVKKVVVNERTGLKEKLRAMARAAKQGYRAGVQEGKAAGREEGQAKGVMQGYRQGLAEGALAGEIAGKRSGRKEGAKEERARIAQARKEFVEALGEVLAEAHGELSPAQARSIGKAAASVDPTNARQVAAFIAHAQRIVDNANYADDLAAARKARKQAAKAAKTKNLAHNHKEALKAAAAINVSHIEDPAAYAEAVDRYIQGVTTPKVGTGKGVGTMTTEELEGMVEGWAEEMNEHYAQLLRDEHGIDPGKLSAKEILDVLNAEDTNAALQALDDAKKAEAEAHILAMAEERLNALQDHSIDDQTTDAEPRERKEEKAILKAMQGAQVGRMTPSQQVRFIHAANNILLNNAFHGAGYVAAISQATAAMPQALQVAAKMPVRQLFSERLAHATMSLSDVFNQFFGWRNDLGKIQSLIGITEFDRGKKRWADAKRDIDKKAAAFYVALRKKYGKKADSNAAMAAEGLVGHVIQMMPGMSDKASFDARKKMLAEDIKNKLNTRRDKDEATVAQEVFDKVIAPATTREEAMANLKKHYPSAHESLTFLIDLFKPYQAEIQANASTTWNQGGGFGDPYYLPMSTKRAAGSTKELDPNAAMPWRSPNMVPAQSSGTVARQKYNRLPEGRVVDYNIRFNSICSLSDAIYDAYTSPAHMRINEFFKMPDAPAVFGNVENMAFVKERARAYLDAERSAPDTEPTSRFVGKLADRIRGFVVIRALGGFKQILKQFPEAATIATVMLNGRIDIFGRNLFMLGEAAPLLNQYAIGGRASSSRGGSRWEARMADHSSALEAAIRSGNWKRVKHLQEEIGEVLMWSLTTGDALAAKAAWLSFYEQARKRQGHKVTSWEAEAQNQQDGEREAAAAYAESMVDRLMASTDPAKLANLTKRSEGDNKGWVNLGKAALYSFATFGVQSTSRRWMDVSELYAYGRRKIKGDPSAEALMPRAALASLMGAAVSQSVFLASSIYVGGAINDLLASVWKDLMSGFDDDDDEKDKQAMATATTVVMAMYVAGMMDADVFRITQQGQREMLKGKKQPKRGEPTPDEKKAVLRWKQFKTRLLTDLTGAGVMPITEKVFVDGLNRMDYAIKVGNNDPSVMKKDGTPMDFHYWLNDPANAPLYRYGQGSDKGDIPLGLIDAAMDHGDAIERQLKILMKEKKPTPLTDEERSKKIEELRNKLK